MKTPFFLTCNTRSSSRHLAFPFPALILAGALAAPASQAANGIWATNSGLWSAAGNWTGGIVADGNGFTANFNSLNPTSDVTVRLDGDRTLTNLIFGDTDPATPASWLINNNGDLTNNLILAGATPTITVNTLGVGKTATINAIIEGSSGLTKAGVGTLVFSGNNTYSGNTTIAAGTLQLAASIAAIPFGASAGNVSIANASFLDINGKNTTLNGLSGLGTVTSSTASSVTLTEGANDQTSTFGGVLQNGAGTLALAKTGTGTLTLSGNNTFTGGVTLNAGIIKIGNSGALNSTVPNTFAFGSNAATGTKLQLNGFSITLGALTTNSTIGAPVVENASGTAATLTISHAGAATFAGVLRDGSGDGALSLTKTGSGILTLAGTNSYTGTTWIKDGKLSASNLAGEGNLGSAGSAVILGGTTTTGALYYTGTSATFSRGFTVNAGGGEIEVVNAGSTLTLATGSLNLAGNLLLEGSGKAVISSAVTGTGSLTQAGSGSTTLTNTGNTYAGGTTVNSGLLNVTATSGTALGSDVITNNITVNAGGNLSLSNTSNKGSQQTLTVNSSAAALGGIGFSNNTLSQSQLTSMFTDATNGNGGKGGVLGINNGITYSAAIDLSTFGSGAGQGYWYLGSATATSNIFNGTLTAGAGNTYRLGGGGGTLTLSTTNGLTGSRSLLVGSALSNGNGTVVLSSTHNYTGNTTVTGGAALSIFSDLSLGTAPATATPGQLVLDNGTLQARVNGTVLNANRGISIGPSSGAGSGTLDTNGYSLTYAGIIANNGGVGSLTKIGAGSLTLSGANTYTGATAINGGTLMFSAINNLGAGTAITFSGGTLRYNTGNHADITARTVTLGSGGGTIDTNGNDVTFANATIGTGSFSKTGAGTLTLNAVNAMGNITVSGGTLKPGVASAIPATVNLILSGGGSLDVNGFDTTVTNLSSITAADKVLNSAPGTHKTLTIYNNKDTSVTGSLADNAGTGGTLALTKTGTSILTLAGNNSYTGTTTISAGTLALSGAGAIADASTVNLSTSGAVFNIAGITAASETIGSLAGVSGTSVILGGKNLTTGGDATSTTYAGVISGTGGSLTKAGAGMMTLSGINTFTGGTTILAGRLSVANSSALGLESNNLTIGAGAILQVTSSFNTSRSTTLGGSGNGSGGTFEVAGGQTLDYTSSAVISGTGSLIKTGAGTLSLGGVDTYTGGTYIKEGTLVSTSGQAPGPQPPAGSNLYAHHIYDGATLQIAVGSWSSERQVELMGDQVGGVAKIDITNGFTQQRNGLIYGAGKLDLIGTGRMIVTNANSYSGGTIVENGILQVNNGAGSATGSGAVTVRNNGTLSGLPTAQGIYAGITGAVSGTVEIQSTGKLLASSGGTLTLGGLTLDAGALSTFQLGALTSSPVVNITGSGLFTLPNASTRTIDIINSGSMGVGTYHLFDYTGTAFNSDSFAKLALADPHSGLFNLSLTNNTGNTSIDLDVTAIMQQWRKGGTDTNWSSTANWWTGVVPDGAGTEALFINNNGYAGFGATETVTLDSSRTVGSIAFNNAATAFTIHAPGVQTLTMDEAGSAGSIQIFSAPNTAHANNVIDATIILAHDLDIGIAAGDFGLDLSGSISGAGNNLTKTNAGPLTMSGATANTYDGLTEVAGGTLNLNKSAGIDAIGTGGLQIDIGATAALLTSNQIADSAPVTVNGTLALGTHAETFATLNGGGSITTGDGGVLTIGGAANSVFLGVISGTGSLAKSGTGTLTLAGTNTYTGGTALRGGIVQVGADQNLGGPGDIVFDGGTLFFSGSFTSTRNMLLNSGGANLDTDGSDATLTGLISGAGSLTKSGTGTVTLGTANNYTGDTYINNGILRIGHALALGTAAAGTTIAANGELELDGNGLIVNEPLTLAGGEICNLRDSNTYSGSITLTADSGVDADSGTLIITSGITGDHGLSSTGAGVVELKGTNTYTGTTHVQAGTLSLSNGSAIPDTGAVILADTATAVLQLNNSETIGSLTGGGPTGGNVSLGTNTLTVGDASHTSFGGAISGTGGALTKVGTGTLTLTGHSNYTGATLVSAGTLLVNGSLGDTITTVASEATLGGTGTLAGGVTVNGTLAPGATNSIGTIGMESLYLAHTLLIEWDGTANAIDQVNVTRQLQLGDTSTIVFSGLDGTLTRQAYVFATYGSLSSTFNRFGTVTDLPAGYNIDYTYGADRNQLALVAIPEPRAALLGGIGLLLLLKRRRVA
jgi:autotransporter-associated beta strand protein